MSNIIQFYKDNNKWYADIANVTKDECEMVSGADTFLDMISCGNIRVSLFVETPNNGDDATLIKVSETEDGGCTYKITSWCDVPVNGELWLCAVNKIYFGYHPDYIKIYKTSIQ